VCPPQNSAGALFALPTLQLTKGDACLAMSPGYIPFLPIRLRSRITSRPPSAGRCALPCGSARRRSFPMRPERKYTPCDAPKEELTAFGDFLGLDKNVIVQAISPQQR